jgi:hypothetical protein
MRVSARELERKRRRVARISAGLGPESGWIVDGEVAASIVPAFGHLKLRDGFRLVTFVYRDSTGGNGWTFAFPQGATTPTSFEVQAKDEFPPSRPPGSLPDFMGAIEGDGSPRSYVEASILGREIAGLGAWWHGIEWSTHTLLPAGDDPQALWGEVTWTESRPEDLRPEVAVDGGKVTVSFWTFSALGEAHVTRHTDRFEAGSLSPLEVSEVVVATGAGGFVP